MTYFQNLLESSNYRFLLVFGELRWIGLGDLRDQKARLKWRCVVCCSRRFDRTWYSTVTISLCFVRDKLSRSCSPSSWVTKTADTSDSKSCESLPLLSLSPESPAIRKFVCPGTLLITTTLVAPNCRIFCERKRNFRSTHSAQQVTETTTTHPRFTGKCTRTSSDDGYNSGVCPLGF